MKKILIMIALMNSYGIAMAGMHSTYYFEQNIALQNQYIQQGIQEGSITVAEATQLQQEQEKLKSEIDKARSDGKMTHEERKTLREEIREHGKVVYEMKNNKKNKDNEKK